MTTVADRYFEAYNALLAMGKTKCQTFCREMNVDKRNFAKKLNDATNRRIIPTAWLTFIVVHYSVSADWLLTGRGKMFHE